MKYTNTFIGKCKKNRGFNEKIVHFYHSKISCFRSTEAPAFFNQCQVRYMMSYKLQKIWWRARHKFFSIAVLRWKILTKLSCIFSNAWCDRNILDLTLIRVCWKSQKCLNFLACRAERKENVRWTFLANEPACRAGNINTSNWISVEYILVAPSIWKYAG
jgi:hypothetical protein